MGGDKGWCIEVGSACRCFRGSAESNLMNRNDLLPSRCSEVEPRVEKETSKPRGFLTVWHFSRGREGGRLEGWEHMLDKPPWALKGGQLSA